MYTNNDKMPENLSECFDILTLILESSEDTEWFASSDEDDFLNSTHHALGEWIRNNWSLWDKSSSLYLHFSKMGLWHPDDISRFILRSYHRYVNNKDLDLPSQISKYIEYWKNHKNIHGPIN